MTKIKICGITNLKDAKACAKLNVDYIGFIFAKSPRQVTPERVREIIKKLPRSIEKVGVFVDENPEEINKIADYCGLDLIQLHGNEKPSDLKKIKKPVIKAIQIKNKQSLLALSKYSAKAFLLDTYEKGKAGGTGKTFNWYLALFAKKFKKPIFLSGGLNSDNVADAVRKVRPYAVDASSGIEEKPGLKDIDKLREFIRVVREVK